MTNLPYTRFDYSSAKRGMYNWALWTQTVLYNQQLPNDMNIMKKHSCQSPLP